jgi:RNA polymerase sigma factor (sigma-70 family)
MWHRHISRTKNLPSISLDAPLRNDPRLTLKDIISSPSSQDPALADKTQEKERILQIIESLKPKYKEVLILHGIEQKTYKEIAEILKTSTTVIGIRLLRARKILRKKLKKDRIL